MKRVPVWVLKPRLASLARRVMMTCSSCPLLIKQVLRSAPVFLKCFQCPSRLKIRQVVQHPVTELSPPGC